MPLINFKPEFSEKVKAGLLYPEHPKSKRQTIRPKRKNGNDPKKGDTLFLYTGCRTNKTEKLGEATCKDSSDIIIDVLDNMFSLKIVIWINGTVLEHGEVNALALKDGFEPLKRNGIITSSAADNFIRFFIKNYSFPFNGKLIKW